MELLEREQPLAWLEALLDEARAGVGRIALVSGEAGIGKTSLVERFAANQAGKIRVLEGACDAHFTPRSFAPLFDMAAQLQGTFLELLNSDANPSTIFSAILGELQRHPVIMVFEDVHWADESTLDLLRYLGRRIAQTRSLVILTYRDDELGSHHPLRILLGDLAFASATRRIPLSQLSEKAVGVLAAGHNLDVAALHRQTNGNPFFVTEVLASGGNSIPATIQDAVLARAARLSPSGYAALEVAAMLGPHIEPFVLVPAAGENASAIDESIAGGILIMQGEVAVFRHEIARQIIFETISLQRKRFLHQTILDLLSASPTTRGDKARLAYHAEGAGNRQAVLEHAPAAARQASIAGAHHESAAFYALALRYAEDLPIDELALLLEAYSQESNMTEQPMEAITARKKAIDIWRELHHPLKQGESLAHLAILLRNNGNNREAEQVSLAAIEILEALQPGRELAIAYRAQATLRLANRDDSEAILWGEKAIALAESVGEKNTLPMAHIAVGSAWLFLDYARGLDYLKYQLEITHHIGHERHIANFYAYLGACCAELFQFPEAEDFLAQGIAYTAERSLDIMRRNMLAWQAIVHIHLGRWSEANEITNELSRNPLVAAVTRIPALVAVGSLRARRGDPNAQAPLNEALELAVLTGTLPHLGLVMAARAETAWLAGNFEKIVDEARPVFNLAFSKRHAWFTGELAFWMWKAGVQVQIPDWTARPFALQIAGNWSAAAADWERLGCPYEQARALADGDGPAQAAALEIFERLGAEPAAEALRRKLQAAGGVKIPRKPRSSTRQNPFGLTDRQVEILELLIEGLSNLKIASQLHISPKTTDHHVTAILERLSVHSRLEAVSLAKKHPRFKK